jgi:hypothetical protein
VKPFTDHSHALFMRDLKNSHEVTLMVAAWLRSAYGLRIPPIQPPIIAPHQDVRHRYADNGDIHATDYNGDEWIIEAKGLNYHFTCAEDWPHHGPDGRKRVFVGGVSSVNKMLKRKNTRLIINLNAARTHCLTLDPKLHDKWTKVTYYNRDERLERDSYAADISLVKFFPFPPPKGVPLT